MCMVRKEWKGLKPLIVKLGGFPEDFDQQLEQFLKVIHDNKAGISFRSVAALAKANKKAIIENLPVASIVGNDKVAELIKMGMEDPASLFDPRHLFDHFANSRGTMGFEEFNNVFVQLNLKINHARMLQIFSAADVEKRGELRYMDFKRTVLHLKSFLVHELMENLNLSVMDMAISFSISVSMLLLMLAFVFVGI